MTTSLLSGEGQISHEEAFHVVSNISAREALQNVLSVSTPLDVYEVIIDMRKKDVLQLIDIGKTFSEDPSPYDDIWKEL